MWTGRTVSLTELVPDFPLQVLRDGSFRHLGLLSTPLEHLLVPLWDTAALPALAGASRVAAVLASPELASSVPGHLAVATVDQPLETLLRIHAALVARPDFWWRSFPSRIAGGAAIHPSAVIAARDVVIGADVRIGPLAVIHERTVVEDGAIIQAGSVLGGDGFEIRSLDGRPTLICHGGGVRVGAGALIQSNVTIDRALFGGFTELGAECALADAVHLAHAVRIGRRSRLAAGVVVGGSTTIGEDVWVGLNATIANGIAVGDGSYVTMGAVVTQDVPPGQRVSGNWALPHDRFLESLRRSR